MNNVVAICLGACSLVLFTHLLRQGNIGGTTYTVLVLGGLVLSFAVARIDYVSELDLKNAKVVLQQAEQLKADLFEKVEAVQRLAEELGVLAAWNVRTVNRIV